MTTVPKLLLVLLLVADTAFSSLNAGTMKMCGEVLIKTREVICKYSTEEGEYPESTTKAVPWPWLSSEVRANKDEMLIKHCCNESCSMNDFMTYC